MTKILVTGGTGFIGSHTVIELQQHGFDVIIIDNLSNSSIGVLDNIAKITGIRPEFEQFDLTDPSLTSGFFSRNRDIAGIIHFAAFKAVGESMAKPLEYYRNNVFSMINVLDGMKSNQIRDLVHSSSCAVYGQPDELPVAETSPFKPATSPYGNTKQICEDIMQYTALSVPIRAIALRYFNPIGAHESAFIGELPLGVPNNLIPFITQTAIGKRPHLNVFGNDYNTPDGTAVRDYIHVVDIARAHLLALERLLNEEGRSKVEAFNLGAGRGFSVLEIIESFERVSGEKLNYKLVDRRPGDVDSVWADTGFAFKELGWKAERGLDEMLSSAWKWEQSLAKIN